LGFIPVWLGCGDERGTSALEGTRRSRPGFHHHQARRGQDGLFHDFLDVFHVLDFRLNTEFIYYFSRGFFQSLAFGASGAQYFNFHLIPPDIFY
jgi:hypothetical protein